MNRTINREQLLDELQAALDVAGARPGGWPEAQRARLAAFVESDEKAAALFAEAKALDRVLDRAQGAGGADIPAGLEARIVAAANMTTQPPHHDRSRRKRSRKRASEGRRNVWQAAALLAASLIVGVFIGLSGTASPVLNALNMIASSDSDTAAGIAGALFEPGSTREEQL
jgi:biopolymer transport protein ExbB/TolQ